jgi:hypothetical protein
VLADKISTIRSGAPFRTLFGQDPASRLRKKGQVGLENVDVGEDNVKRGVIDNASRFSFEVFKNLELNRPRYILMESVWSRTM